MPGAQAAIPVLNPFSDAAQEEADHLAWCETRLQELDAEPSKLNLLLMS